MSAVVLVAVVGWLAATGVVAAACEALEFHQGVERDAELQTRRLRDAGLPGRFVAGPLLDDDALIVGAAAWIVAHRAPVALRGRFLVLAATTVIGEWDRA